MKLVVQRVSRANVVVSGAEIGAIGPGLVIFVGVGKDDTAKDAALLAEKVANLRIFSDAEGKMNLSAKQQGFSALIISQFTLFADCSRGRRPYFGAAATPERAERLYELFCAAVEQNGLPVQKGRFRSQMEVGLVNDGPVTIWLDSREYIV
jgi:D-tyrosyl-tRNA(Tyr) deacylase